MNSEDSRIPTPQETVKGLYKAAKTLNPDNKFSIRSFEGSEFDNVASETELDDIVSSMTFDTGANVAKPLREKILEPLATAAMENRLNPTIVVIITDGDVSPQFHLCPPLSFPSSLIHQVVKLVVFFLLSSLSFLTIPCSSEAPSPNLPPKSPNSSLSSTAQRTPAQPFSSVSAAWATTSRRHDRSRNSTRRLEPKI